MLLTIPNKKEHCEWKEEKMVNGENRARDDYVETAYFFSNANYV